MKISYFNTLIEQKLLATHTCYLAKVFSVNGNTATIQPLSLSKLYGRTAEKQAVIQGVPVSQTVLRSLRDNERLTSKVAVVICSERDISQTKKGIFSLPSIRRHSLSDSIIIGFL